MAKERSPSHELEQHSRGMFLARFSNWVVNSLVVADYAFDFEVRPTGQFVDPLEVRQSPFYVQLKASEQFDDPESVWCDLDTRELTGDFLSASIPAMLCIYERSSDQFNWCVLQPYCWDILNERNPDWRSQSEVRIRTGRDPLGATDGKQRLMQAVARAQRRITMRASIAFQRRDSFDHPLGDYPRVDGRGPKSQTRINQRCPPSSGRRPSRAGAPTVYASLPAARRRSA